MSEKKVLYFEGAGWSGADVSKATVGNCRIRTAFHLDDGDKVYLELNGMEVTPKHAKHLQEFNYAGFVMHYTYQRDVEGVVFEYSRSGILKLVNSLGASFDEIKVLPDLGGYRVHKDHAKDGDRYNFGDEFQYDPELIAKREAIHAAIYAMEKAELEADKAAGTKKFVHSPSGGIYPNFSLWVDSEDPSMLHLLRHFSGYNRHWTIDATAENWQETMKEVELGKYGC